MAEWKHKERNWSRQFQDNLSGESIDTYYGPVKVTQNFPEWLDWQCEEGWEIFKISRNFNEQARVGTWCIFRKRE